MPKKSKRVTKSRRRRTRKQRPIRMIGCSLRNKSCPNCGPNCRCGPHCMCPKPCPGNCLNTKGMRPNSKGGSGCGSSGCPISPMSWTKMNKFGGSNSHISPVPGPFVGKQAWTSSDWPGQNGIGGDNNYLKAYNTNNDPALQMTSNASGYNTQNSKIGGNKRGGNKRGGNKRGGGLIPQDLVNLGRDFGYNFKTAYNAINGYKPPVDPSPYKGQLPPRGI